MPDPLALVSSLFPIVGGGFCFLVAESAYVYLAEVQGAGLVVGEPVHCGFGGDPVGQGSHLVGQF